ncbi:cytochrome P450 3A9-like isoform X2 [Ornithodoros turicata]|uniref:cytochrome P450 3A9-like isoform X2 n=1 Tax=Ornithodoros turicata TaxID=34597 RepID=UPI00313A0068
MKSRRGLSVLTARRACAPVHEVFLDSRKEYGRVYGTYQDTYPCLVVGDPDLLRHIYVKNFLSFADRTVPGEVGNQLWDRMLNILPAAEWREFRNILTTCFTSARLKMMLPKIAHVANRTGDIFLELAKQNETANVHDISLKSTLDVIAAVAFSIEADSYRNPENPLRKYYYNVFSGDNGGKVLMYFRMPGLFKLFQLLGLRLVPERYSNNFCGLMQMIIRERMQDKLKMDDQLQILLDAMAPNDDKEIQNAAGKRMSIHEVISQSLLLLAGGSDTTAWALTTVLYLLALNESCQEKLIEEIDRVIGKDEVTYDKLQSVHYLEAVINEALRLSRVNPYHFRQCTSEAIVNGIHFTPGMAVIIPIDCIHRDPEFFPEPEVFEPERFLPRNKDKIGPFTFAPFGFGPRNCFGMRQAMLHLKIFLVCIFQKVKFQRCMETVEHVAYKPRSFFPQLASPIILRPVAR